MATATKAPARSATKQCHTTFEYSARDRSGKLVKGSLEANDAAAVLARLKSQGLAPVSVEASKAGKGVNMEINLPGSNRVGLKDLALMSRQFATMANLTLGGLGKFFSPSGVSGFVKQVGNANKDRAATQRADDPKAKPASGASSSSSGASCAAQSRCA